MQMLKINDKLPRFNLIGTDGNEYKNESFNREILIVIFTCNHCPYAQAYEKRLINLHKLFHERGVDFVAINANDSSDYPEDNFENMIKRAAEIGLTYPYLRDESQEVAKLFGASYTPEVFAFNKERLLKYHGRIDDNWQETNKVKKENLKEAIEAILSGKVIDRANTQAIGCTVKWSI